MTEDDYKQKGFPPENGKSVVDYVSVQTEGIRNGLVHKYELITHDHYRSDHVTIKLELRSALAHRNQTLQDAGKTRKRPTIEFGTKPHTVYSATLCEALGGWINRCVHLQPEWGNQRTAHRLMREFLEILLESAASATGFEQGSSRKARVKRKPSHTQAPKRSRKKRRTTIAPSDRALADGKEAEHKIEQLERELGEGKTEALWDWKKAKANIATHNPLPRAFTGEGGKALGGHDPHQRGCSENGSTGVERLPHRTP